MNNSVSTSNTTAGVSSIQDPRQNSNYYNLRQPLPLNTSIPPPQIHPTGFSYDLSLPPLVMFETKTDDELFAETWLSKIGKINLNLESTVIEFEAVKEKKKAKKVTLSIHEARIRLKKYHDILIKLQETQRILAENFSMSTEEWKKHTTAIGALKDELTIIMSPFQNEDILKSLQISIKQRTKKRATQKRRRSENRLQAIKRQKDLVAYHAHIDSWLAAKKEETERIKAEENMKRDADCVLSEVTKKKADARKQLSLIASLIKLRNVRETAAKACGEKIPAEDNAAFCKTTETLIKLWENASKTYAIEEQGLKLMLEQNATEDSKQVRANKEKDCTQQWNLVLFGNGRAPSPYYVALTAAQRDMENFIGIRKSWDTFVSTNVEKASKIPLGWVLPRDKPSLEWSQYQQQI